MHEQPKQPTIEEQLKIWLSYLERGIHSGNKNFDTDTVRALLEKYRKQKEFSLEIIKETENWVNSQKNVVELSV